MPTQILPVASTAVSSADVVVAAGTPLTVALKGLAFGNGNAVDIELKDDAGAYQKVDSLSYSRPALVIGGPGTYRFTRSGGMSCGVFSG